MSTTNHNQLRVHLFIILMQLTQLFPYFNLSNQKKYIMNVVMVLINRVICKQTPSKNKSGFSQVIRYKGALLIVWHQWHHQSLDINDNNSNKTSLFPLGLKRCQLSSMSGTQFPKIFPWKKKVLSLPTQCMPIKNCYETQIFSICLNSSTSSLKIKSLSMSYVNHSLSSPCVLV